MQSEVSSADREVFESLLLDVKRCVDAELEVLFGALDERVATYGAPVAATVHALRDLTMRGGKRFRPAMLAAAYLAVGRDDDVSHVTQAGVALELLQSYFLIHDDWMDHDEVRRGGPSVHALLGRTFGSEHAGAVSAILAGDLAVSMAQLALATQRAEATRLIGAQLNFAMTQLDVVFGQMLDVHATARTRSDVERMHSLKTTSYTVAGPVSMGAALAGADVALQAALRRYTEPLGLAFQLRDDLLGTFGDPKVTGKPVGNDIREGKHTALVLELLDDPQGRALLTPYISSPSASNTSNASATPITPTTPTMQAAAARSKSDAEVAVVVEYMITSGARARVERRLDQLLGMAEAALGQLDLREQGRRALLGAVAALGARRR